MAREYKYIRNIWNINVGLIPVDLKHLWLNIIRAISIIIQNIIDYFRYIMT